MEPAYFEAKVLSVLRENRAGRWVGGQDSGRLDQRSLHKHTFSDRIFKQKLASSTKDYWVSILVDSSGSMDGAPIRSAIKAAAQMAVSCDKVGINTEIIIFCSYPAVVKPFGMKLAKAKLEEIMDWYITDGRNNNSLTLVRQYGSPKSLYLYDSGIKDLGGWRKQESRVREFYGATYLKNQTYDPSTLGTSKEGGSTKIGLAYKQAADSLSTKTGGKFICVFTDGQEDPMNEYHDFVDIHGRSPCDVSGETVTMASLAFKNLYAKTKDEIRLIGVGIGSDYLSSIVRKEDLVLVDGCFQPHEIYNGVLKIMRDEILGS